MLTQQSWLDAANELGLRTFYIWHPDYPPGTLSLFWIADRIFPGGSFGAIKFLIFTALLLTAFSIGLIVKSINAATVALAVLIPSTVGLGYIDILFGLPLVLSFWALSTKKYWAFSLLFASASLIKWQPLLLLPFLIIYLLGTAQGSKPWRARSWALAWSLLPGLALGLVTCLIFTFGAMGVSLARIWGQPFFSGNGLNFEWLLIWLNNGFHGPMRWAYISEVPAWMPILGQALTAIALIFIALMFALSKRSYDQLLFTMIVGFVAYSAFNTNVHENHWFIACLLALVALWRLPHLRLPLLTVIAIAVINLVGLYGMTGVQNVGTRLIGPLDLSVLVALVFVVSTVYLIVTHAQEMRRDRLVNSEVALPVSH